MKTLLIILSFLLLPLLSNGQTLYLRLDDALPREHSGSWHIRTKPPNPKLGKVFGYHNYMCGAPLTFYCDDQATLSQILPASAISNYPIMTHEQLEATWVGKTKNQILDYLEGLQAIYIVEILPNNTIEVSRVELAVTFHVKKH